MLVYTSTKASFVDDVRTNQIEDRILEQMGRSGLGGTSPSEVASWRNSMQYMMNILEHERIPRDAGVAIEYLIPQTSKRIDFILTGQNENGHDIALIIELKQWENAEATRKDGIVETFVGGAKREVLHPSYQAWTYAALLEDFNGTVQDERVLLRPCSYLHNCTSKSINSPFYKDHIERAPAFLKKDMEKIQDFITRHVRKGDQRDLIYRIENGRIKPSKSLATHLASLLQGNPDFLMIDDQKLVYESALEIARFAEGSGKQVLIVEGGPGTGKSVVAINLLVGLTSQYRNVHYVTPNRAPRQVYESRLTGVMTKTRYGNLFKGSASYDKSAKDEMDTLVVDEAHRLVERSTWQKKGTHQVRDLIHAARSAVFFVDDGQQVTWKDTGSREEITRWANHQNATIHYTTLRSQFRCNGSDGYLAWLDQVLQRKETAQTDLLEIDYEMEVFDSPSELRDRIFALDRAGHKARLMAGYCWDWNSKRDIDAMDIVFPEDDFAMQWNLADDEGRYLEKDHSRNQIGCIHTVQGLELDYAGVIIGPDLIVRYGEIQTHPENRAKTDRSLDGYKTRRKEDAEDADRKADILIKNTYRTLMSRGLKGCFIYCTDPETREWFRNKVQEAGAKRGQEISEPASEDDTTQPFDLLHRSEVTEESNAVPYLDLPVAAGGFAGGFAEHQTLDDGETWIELPDIYRARSGLFVARVTGKSMNRRVPDGALCLFEANPGGSRNGRVMLVYHRNIDDPDHGGGLTVKVYQSEKRSHADHEWEHSRIVLACDTLEHGYEDIVLDVSDLEDLWVLGEYRGTIDGR